MTTVEDLEVLFISGSIIRKITKLSSNISRDIFSIAVQATMSEKTAYTMIDKAGLCFDGEKQFRAYSRILVADNPQDSDLKNTSSPEFHEIFLLWRTWLRKEASEEQTERPKYHMAIENTGTFVYKQHGFTEKNLMCLVPAQSIVGDQICLL